MTTQPGDGDESAEFIVSFEGSAVDAHAMPVRDLAPALLALGNAFDRANELLNGNRAQVSLEIRAVRQGSFEIVLILEQLLEQGVAFFADDFVSSAANIKELFFSPLGGGGTVAVGLFSLIKRLKGRAPKRVEPRPNDEPDAVILEVENLRLSVPSKVFDLHQDGKLKQLLEDVVKPVLKEGIDRLVVRQDGEQLEEVSTDDVGSFRVNDSDADTPTETIIPRQRLKPASVNFSKDGKWRLHDGEKTHWYSINDADFAKEVEEGKRRFGAGDLLVCEVVLTQTIDADGELKLRYSINRVLSHSHGPEQAALIDD